MGFMF